MEREIMRELHTYLSDDRKGKRKRGNEGRSERQRERWNGGTEKRKEENAAHNRDSDFDINNCTLL